MALSAFVTGGSRGIGLGIAKKLIEEGYDIAINGVRPEESVQDVLTELRASGQKVIYCQGNVAEAEDRKNIVERLKANFESLNVLVNNAGVAPKARLDMLETTEESYDFVMDINLKGVFFLTQAIANWQIESKQKDKDFTAYIINISSISATVASVNRAEYCLSKAGIGMMTQLFAARLGEFGIPVYEVRPGVIKTDMTSGVTAKYDKLIAEGLNIQPRWGYPDDIGKAVASLAKGDFPFSTGNVFMVDGGLTVLRM